MAGAPVPLFPPLLTGLGPQDPQLQEMLRVAGSPNLPPTLGPLGLIKHVRSRAPWDSAATCTHLWGLNLPLLLSTTKNGTLPGRTGGEAVNTAKLPAVCRR